MAIFVLGKLGQTQNRTAAKAWLYAAILTDMEQKDPNLRAHPESPAYRAVERKAMELAEEQINRKEQIWNSARKMVEGMFGRRLDGISI